MEFGEHIVGIYMCEHYNLIPTLNVYYYMYYYTYLILLLSSTQAAIVTHALQVLIARCFPPGN